MASLGKCSDLSRRIFSGDEVLAFFNGDFDVTNSDVSLYEESSRNDDVSSRASANLDDDERETTETIGAALFRSLL